MITSATILRRPPAYLDSVQDKDCTFHVGLKPTDFDGTQSGRGAKFRCLHCGSLNGDEVVREAAQSGAMGSCLTSAVCSSGKFNTVLGSDFISVNEPKSPKLPAALDQEISREHRCVLYGFRRFPSLFSPRQMTALLCFSGLVNAAKERIQQDLAGQSNSSQDPSEYAEAVAIYLAFAVDRAADYWSQMATWMPRGTVRQTFARQRIAMNWDWAEANPFGNINCSWDEGVGWIAKAIERLPLNPVVASVSQVSASAHRRISEPLLVSTDPPYYDNIPYADCSDYFYVWMRLSLSNLRSQLVSGLFATLLTPKTDELVASLLRHQGSRDGAKRFFEEGLGKSFVLIREDQDQDYPLTVYYAFKQTESDDDSADEGGNSSQETSAFASTGWETMLTALSDAGLSINGTWPVRTERGARNISIGTNALASSIVLVCRPRSEKAPLTTRRDFLITLKRELPDALKHLQEGSIAPVDLAQAAIGPGMAVFTRYAKVMEADGSPMKVRQALTLINQTLDEVLAEQEGEFDADTRWAIAWFEQFGMDDGPFGDAETLSKAKNTAVNALVEAGIVQARGGKVRLLNRSEMPTDWTPATDNRLPNWQVVQQVIYTLEQKGESAAAALMHTLGGMAETARDLAYRLYNICERKKWADEALAYNGLVIAWPELTKLAMVERSRSPAEQKKLEF